MNTPGNDGRGPVENVFIDLYQAYSPAVYRLAYRLLGDGEEAGDITQETFSKLFQAMGERNEIMFPKTWIFAVAANACRDLLRRKRKTRDALSRRPEDDGRVGSEKELELKTDVEVLRKALRRLKERDRVLVMLYLEDLSYKELAQATGIRASSIGKTLSRTIGKLANIVRNGDRP